MSTLNNPKQSHAEVAAEVAEATSIGFRVVEVGFVVVIGLLVCPPLAILVVVVVVPLFVIALVLGLLAAILSVPYLLVEHFRGRDRGHLSLLVHRLGHAARSLVDLAPHRIVSDARKPSAGR
jgi:hypothetical protein